MVARTKSPILGLVMLGLWASCNEQQTKSNGTGSGPDVDNISRPGASGKPKAINTEFSETDDGPIMEEMDFMPPIEENG
ncbi:MAG: hypothetical protein AAF039_09060 [Bacteroidota bacterium]